MESVYLSIMEATLPSICDNSCTKTADNSATALFKESVTGSAGKKVTVKFVQTGSDKVVEYMNYVLEDCLVSGYSISGDSESDPVEQISLSFSKIMVNYNDFDKSNKSSSPQRVGYDLTTAKPL